MSKLDPLQLDTQRASALTASNAAGPVSIQTWPQPRKPANMGATLCRCCVRKPVEGEEYKNHGMLQDSRRKCRDVFCCLLFSLFCE
jgi:hypothetical protein